MIISTNRIEDGRQSFCEFYLSVPGNQTISNDNQTVSLNPTENAVAAGKEGPFELAVTELFSYSDLSAFSQYQVHLRLF